MKLNTKLNLYSFFIIGLYLYGLGAWIVNLIAAFNCDYESPYREEIIHLIGVFVPPTAMLTVWY